MLSRYVDITIYFKTCDKEQEGNLEVDQAHMRATLMLMDGWRRRRRTDRAGEEYITCTDDAETDVKEAGSFWSQRNI